MHLVGFIIGNLSRCTVTWTSNLSRCAVTWSSDLSRCTVTWTSNSYFSLLFIYYYAFSLSYIVQYVPIIAPSFCFLSFHSASYTSLLTYHTHTSTTLCPLISLCIHLLRTHSFVTKSFLPQYFLDCLTSNMKAARSFETSVTTLLKTWRHIPENLNFQQYR